MQKMEVNPPTTSQSDSNSTSEYMDAEGGSECSDHTQDPDDENENEQHGIISELQEGLGQMNLSTGNSGNSSGNNKNLAPTSDQSASSRDSDTSSTEEPRDLLQDEDWLAHKKHIFILSEAGKPVYSLHGSENRLASLFGIIQALVSFVQLGQDTITSIHTRGIKFVFLLRNSLILVAASRTNMSVPQLHLQLNDVYNQVLSTLTFSHMNKIFEKRKNFDLRRLLAGSERLIYNLLANESSCLKVSDNVFTFLTNSIRVFPLATGVRASIVAAIQSNCAKIKNLVFAVLIADNKLITFLRMKKYSIHPADLRLIFNLIECSASFRASENWTPICLPRFDRDGYLHAHVSYLEDDCQACLLLLSVDRDAFFTLSAAKQRITEKLKRNRCIEAINDEMGKARNAKLYQIIVGIPELRHFLYKPRTVAQLLCPVLRHPYKTLEEFERLEAIYCDLLHRTRNATRPVKLIYEMSEREIRLAWVTSAYELYAVFEPTVDRPAVIKYVDKLIKWIEKEYDTYFIRNHSTF